MELVCSIFLPWGLSELASSCCGNSLHSLLPSFSGLYEQTFTPRSQYMSAAGHQKLCWTLWGSTRLGSAPCVCTDAQSCPALCDPMDCSPPGSSVHGIFQARILELVALSYSRGSSRPRDWTHISVSPALAGQFFTYHCTTCETLCSMGLLLLWDLAWRGSPHLQHDAVTAQGRSSREEEVNQQAHGKVLLQCGISQICWYISGQSNSRDSV